LISVVATALLLYFESGAVIVRDMHALVKWLPGARRARGTPDMLRRLGNIGWIVAFVVLCVFYVSQVVRATRLSETARDGASWVCPIAGKCGPAGTPGLGRW
jgi:hypothetical protein